MSNKAKRTHLMNEAADLSSELDYIEWRLPEVLREIKKLKPTKTELEDGLQELFDIYSI